MNFIEEKIIEKVNGGIKPMLRFPPEPNAASLHLGHVKSMCLNFGLAEKYHGKCNLRFDDTNPSVEKSEYIDAIIDDINWLGYKPAEILYASDYFDTIFGYAVKLIEMGLAYIDDSTSEEIANEKGDVNVPGIESKYRSRTIDENLELFYKMRDGVFDEGYCTLRLKIDMSNPNMILRDPIIYRIIKKEHHHVGNKWCIYPMYDFAHPISDYIEGITDSLCTLEFEVHRPLYNWILNNLNLEGTLPEETEFARLNITKNILSKRKLKKLVEEKYVSGWDDPRLMTISGLRRRGYTPSAIKNFCDIVGYTKRDSLIDIKLLEECLRTELNKTTHRYMCIFNPIKLTITNWDGDTEICSVENNPENTEDGSRDVIFSKSVYIESDDFREEANNKYHRLKLGGEVRLKGAYIVRAYDVVKNENGEVVEVLCTYDPTTRSGESDRKVKGTIHWVSCDENVTATVRNYSDIFTFETPDKEDNFIEYFNENSLKIESVICEKSITNCVIGKAVQFMRNGYFTLDADSTENSLVFNKTVSLKDSFKM